jgi:hypothetical protein
MKVSVIFYYVGHLQAGINAYSVLLGTAPSYADEGWARFNIEGSDLAIHLDPSLPRIATSDPVKYGAVVSLSVEAIHDFLALAKEAGFISVGEVQNLPYGLQAQIRDPSGNRLTVLQPQA